MEEYNENNLCKYLQILFIKYLSYHSSISNMTHYKYKIYNQFKINESQFDRIFWRAQRVLLFKREYNSIKFLTNDKELESITFDNYFRQLGYFKGEIRETISKNKNDFNFNLSEKAKIYLNAENNDLDNLIDNALYPTKNPNIDLKKVENRYFNSGSYFIEKLN